MQLILEEKNKGVRFDCRSELRGSAFFLDASFASDGYRVVARVRYLDRHRAKPIS